MYGAPGFSLERIIANVYMHRAKRAFWSGKSWREFEAEESLLKAQNRVNEVRLAVFGVLKHRLCEEIWLEPYRPPLAVVLSLPMREDSKVRQSDGQPDFETSDEDDS